MNKRTHVNIWIYILAIIAVIAAGCSVIRRQAFQPVSVDSPQGEILVTFLSYELGCVKKMTAIPKLSVTPVVFRVVLIDPGHGGKDPGTQGAANMPEKDIVLDVSLRLQAILMKNGFSAPMTRNQDEFISLEKRMEMIRQYQPDLFLSLHANSSPDKSVSGLEVFAAEKETYWTSVHEAINGTIAESDKVLPDISAELYRQGSVKERNRKQSEALAKHLALEVTNAIHTRNRGVKHKHFYVLNEAAVPSVLVEMGFLTNMEEERKLITPEYRQAMAEALAKSLLNYVEPQQ